MGSTGPVCATTASQGATARCSTARAAADGTNTASMARALAVLAGPARIAIYESAQPTATGGATATMARAIAALATAVARARRNRAPTSARDTARATRHLRACASLASPASTVRCGFAQKIAPTTAIAT